MMAQVSALLYVVQSLTCDVECVILRYDTWSDDFCFTAPGWIRITSHLTKGQGGMAQGYHTVNYGSNVIGTILGFSLQH
jgi:hypothetical protein